MSRLTRLAFVFTLAMLADRPVFSQTLHLIFFGDTRDPEIGGPTRVSYTYYDRFADQVKEYAEFKAVRKQQFTGEDFSRENLDKALASLNVESQDVVLFYISSHGWNDGTTDYPMLVMESGVKAAPQNSVNLKDVYDQVMAKSARLTIVFGEACNADRAVRPKAGPARTAAHPLNEVNTQSFRELFKRSKLGVLACSSRKGQISMSDREEGGRFTQAFFSVMSQYTATDYRGTVDWNNLMRDVRLATQRISVESGSKEQDPFYEIETLMTDVAEATPAERVREPPQPVKPLKAAAVASNNRPAQQKPPVATGGNKPVPSQQSPTGASGNKPAPKPAGRPKSVPCFNPTAFETVRIYQRFVENYWKSIDHADIDDARELFSNQVYSEDVKEFYGNISEKLQVLHLPAEKERLDELGNNMLEILAETNQQLSNSNFLLKASSKLAMVVTDLSKIIGEVEAIKRDCRER